MLYRILTLALATAVCLAVTPNALADGSETRGYTTSLGASVFGTGAAGNNAAFGPGTFTSAHGHTRALVDIQDDSGTDPYVTVCVDLNSNSLCSVSDGDIQVEGLGTVALSAPTAFTTIIVYVYAVHVAEDTSVHLGTTGSVTVTWG